MQVAVTTFAVYVFAGNTLTASKAFVALSLFGIMRFPLGYFPDVIAACIQVSLKTNCCSFTTFEVYCFPALFSIILVYLNHK